MKMVDIIAKANISNKKGNYHELHQDFFPASTEVGDQHVGGLRK